MKAIVDSRVGTFNQERVLVRDFSLIFANLRLKLYSLLLLTDGHDVTVGARLAHVPLELHRAVQAHIVEGGLAVGSARAPDETTHLG